MSASPRRARIRGASEQVASEIQHFIQRQGLGPGDFLGREEDLAAEFGVSRPTLREALKMLASGNLIRASKGPGGGIFVALTADQGMSRSLSDAIAMMLETRAVSLAELLEARLVLEVPLAGQAAYRADAETVRELRAALAAGDESALHRIVAATAGNRMVQAFTDWVFEVLQPTLMDVIGHAVLRMVET
jgi:GntR family transcriptional regulator, transcriptional repressor for pyruvate dehydrogenase complex